MTDPPITSAVSAPRPTMEPDALSPLSYNEEEDLYERVHFFVETGPSGSTEVSVPNAHSQPFDELDDKSDVELENIPQIEESFVPPSALSSSLLSMRGSKSSSEWNPMPIRERAHSSSSGSFEKSVPALSMMDSNQQETPSTIIPRVQEIGLTPKIRNSAIVEEPSISTSTSAHLGPQSSRKSLRYSSLKKRKPGPNALLHRLFCNSPLVGTYPSHDDSENRSTQSGSSEENKNPASSGKPTDESQDNKSCTSFITTARESLRLDDEAQVRKNIQINISESLLAACSGADHLSPQGFTSSDNNKEEKSNFVDTSVVRNPTFGSVSSRKHCKPNFLFDDGSIQEPKNKISMFDDDDDIAETASHPVHDSSVSSDKPPIQEILSKSKSNGAKTPASSKSSRLSPLKTPGGLVIPLPFTISATSIFPSTFEGCFPTCVEEDKPNTDPPRRRKSSRRWPPEPQTEQENEKSLKENKSSKSSKNSIKPASSTEDLETVHELSPSRETATKGSNSSEEESCRLSKSTSNDLDSGEKKGAFPFDVVLRSSSKTDRSGKADFNTLKAKYERTISEQKEHAASAARLARKRLQEIEKLEGQMSDMRERQIDQTVLRELVEQQLKHIEQEKADEIERMQKQMEAQMAEKIAAAESAHKKEVDFLKQELAGKIHKLVSADEKSLEIEFDSVKKELDIVTAKLEEKEMTTRSKSPPKSADTLYRVTKELNDVKEKLAAKEKLLAEQESCSNQAKEAELERVKGELASVMEELLSMKTGLLTTAPTDIEKELESVKLQCSELTRKLAKKEAENTKHLPPPSPEMSPRPSLKSRCSIHSTESPTESAEQRDAVTASLQKQIESLNEQAEILKKENEQVLEELRLAKNQEMQAVKEHMEDQVREQENKAQEMEKKLTEVNLRESLAREEFLKKLEALRQEWKTEQNRVKKDFRNQEKRFLQQISELQKKEKVRLDGQQQSEKEWQAKNSAEVERLREQLLKQQEEYENRMREITQEATVTNEQDKDSLENQISLLKNQLESEQNAASLVDSKLDELMLNAEAAKTEQNKAYEALKKKTDAEITRLKTELDDREALEEAMQIATNERDTVREKEQKLRAQTLEEKIQHIKTVEELRNKCDTLSLDLDEAAKKEAELEQKLKDQVKIAEQNAEIRCQEIQSQCEKDIISLTKKLADEEAVTMAAIQSESNTKFVAFKLEYENTIDKLRQEIVGMEEQHARDLLDVTKKLKQDETQLLEKFDALKSEYAKKECQLNEAECTHNAQYEEMLNQLDLVEGEHQDVVAQKDKAIMDKQARIEKLSEELDACRKNLYATEQRIINHMEETEREQQKNKVLESKLQIANQEIAAFIEARKQFVKDAEKQREQACEQAREEMIAKAEIQFQQANEHYVKLRKQYDESRERVSKLEQEINSAKRKIESLSKDKQTCEVDFQAEIAAVRADKAKIEADAASKAKEYRREMERLLHTAKEFEARSAESEQNSRNIQKTLATVVGEKDKLQKEYDEMKSVSEELMAIVESQEGVVSNKRYEF